MYRFPTSVHITVSITEYDTTTDSTFTGVTSGYLRSLAPFSSKCRIFVRPSSFRLPKKLQTPIIMIGPGTGIAPMRALLQEREEQMRRTGKSGSNVLYFGCQSVNKDYIYRDELEVFQQNNTLTDLQLAFSRDQEDKVYVQHLLQREKDAAALMTSLEEGAYIYVCGATSMGTDVLETVVSIIQKKKRMSKDGANSFLKELQNNGRYVQELWTA
jgi:NADPH-ferrihemoprotein reductase